MILRSQCVRTPARHNPGVGMIARYADIGITCHWTKHPDRLNRDFGRKQFGDDGYAREGARGGVGRGVRGH